MLHQVSYQHCVTTSVSAATSTVATVTTSVYSVYSTELVAADHLEVTYFRRDVSQRTLKLGEHRFHLFEHLRARGNSVRCSAVMLLLIVALAELSLAWYRITICYFLF